MSHVKPHKDAGNRNAIRRVNDEGVPSKVGTIHGVIILATLSEEGPHVRGRSVSAGLLAAQRRTL
jgi:hypothetical protein